MPAEPEPRRRTFFKYTLASATLAAGGVVGGATLERTAPRPRPLPGDIQVLFDTGTRSSLKKEQATYIATVRTEAAQLARRITPLAVEEGTIQGSTTTTSHMRVDRARVAEAALLLADVQGKIRYGKKEISMRDLVAQAIIQRGVVIRSSDEAAEQTAEGPLRLNIPTTLGYASTDAAGHGLKLNDFPVLQGINALVNYVITTKFTPAVSAENPAALAVTAGYGAAAATETLGATTLFSRRDASRRGVFRGVAAAAAAGAVFFFGERNNYGGTTMNAVNARLAHQDTLGTDYNQPSEIYKPLFYSDLFQTDIANHLVVPTGKK